MELPGRPPHEHSMEPELSSSWYKPKRMFVPGLFRPFPTRVLITCALLSGFGVVGISSLHAPRATAAATDKRLEGAELFATSGCTHCHGSNGEGTEQGPALLELRKHLSAERITDQIAHGGGAMPAFGDVLKPTAIESLVVFLRAKKWASAPVPPASAKPITPPATQASPTP